MIGSFISQKCNSKCEISFEQLVYWIYVFPLYFSYIFLHFSPILKFIWSNQGLICSTPSICWVAYHLILLIFLEIYLY